MYLSYEVDKWYIYLNCVEGCQSSNWIVAIKIQLKRKKASQSSWVTNLIKIQYMKVWQTPTPPYNIICLCKFNIAEINVVS